MKTSKTSAFTLIELLVVISIIAILAGIALPVFNNATLKAKQNSALQQAKGIFYGLKMFAGDHNGSFPVSYDQDNQAGAADPSSLPAPTDSNQIYMNLIPAYVASENPFSLSSSAWCKNTNGAYVTPTNDVNGTDRTKILKQGVNEWAYVLGLSDTSNANYPIMADGFAGGTGQVTSPAYTNDPGAKGGVWSAKQAIVVWADGSAHLMLVNIDKTVHRTDSSGGNFFVTDSSTTSPWLTNCTVYNPK